MEYIANPDPKCESQKGFYAYKKQFSQFSHYIDKTTSQRKRWDHFIIKHGDQKRNRPISLIPFQTSRRIRHSYTPISPQGSRTKKGRARDAHNHYHPKDHLLHPSKRMKHFFDPSNKRKQFFPST